MAEPDLQIRWGAGGGGGGHPDPEIRGGGGGGDGVKNFFSALRAPVWFKNKGRAWLPRAPTLYPPLDSKVSQQF